MLSGWLLDSSTTQGQVRRRLVLTCSVVPAQGCLPLWETGILCCVEQLLPEYYAEAGKISIY